MAIVYPSEAVARRWDGAFEARRRRAPLEEFLRVRSVVVAPTGIAQVSDNVARATVWIVEAGLSLFCADRAAGLALRQQAAVGHVACTARLLDPWIGLNAAALTSASSARQFEKEFMQAPSSLDRLISENVRAAITRDGVETAAALSASIARRLGIVHSAQGICPANDPMELPPVPETLGLINR